MNTLEEAKQAVLDGKIVVYKGSSAYTLVHLDGEWWLAHANGYMPLYYRDGVRSDYKGSDFNVKEVTK